MASVLQWQAHPGIILLRLVRPGLAAVSPLPGLCFRGPTFILVVSARRTSIGHRAKESAHRCSDCAAKEPRGSTPSIRKHRSVFLRRLFSSPMNSSYGGHVRQVVRRLHTHCIRENARRNLVEQGKTADIRTALLNSAFRGQKLKLTWCGCLTWCLSVLGGPVPWWQRGTLAEDDRKPAPGTVTFKDFPKSPSPSAPPAVKQKLGCPCSPNARPRGASHLRCSEERRVSRPTWIATGVAVRPDRAPPTSGWQLAAPSCVSKGSLRIFGSVLSVRVRRLPRCAGPSSLQLSDRVSTVSTLAAAREE